MKMLHGRVEKNDIQDWHTTKTYEAWGYAKWPLNREPNNAEMVRAAALSISEDADYEENVIVRSYPWLVRPVVRWLRRATRR